MLSPTLLGFLASHDFASLTDWARAARVSANVVHLARTRGRIADRHIRALARVVGEDVALVRAIVVQGRAA